MRNAELNVSGYSSVSTVTSCSTWLTSEICSHGMCAAYLLFFAFCRVFGHSGDDAKKIIYSNWLNMVRAGLLGLEFYSPDTNSWRQAHMQARYVILRVLLEADGVVSISERTGTDGEPDLLISLNEENIYTNGRKAIADFLLKLQVLLVIEMWR